MDHFFTKREIYVVEQPDAQQLNALCCAVSGGKLWANGKYITDRYEYGRMLFVYVESGAMFLEYAGQSHVIESGGAFFIDCDPHQIYGAHGDSCELIFLHFMGGPSDYLFGRVAANCGHALKGYAAKLIKSCVEEVLELMKSHMPDKVLRSSEIITNTLFALLLHEAKSDPLFEMAALMIRDAVSKNMPLSVDDLAHRIGYSKFYFTKKFTEATGVPPFEFLLRERMALAKGLLINTSVPVGEIALACGFFDASHMSNCFKKRENVTPSEFRRGWKKTI